MALTEQVLWNFGTSGDGVDPVAGLIADQAGNLYGTDSGGGRALSGTVFELSRYRPELRRVELRATRCSRRGFPGTLHLTVRKTTIASKEKGGSCETIRNTSGDTRPPVFIGSHPWLSLRAACRTVAGCALGGGPEGAASAAGESRGLANLHDEGALA